MVDTPVTAVTSAVASVEVAALSFGQKYWYFVAAAAFVVGLVAGLVF
ncbi:MAG: hypothetical protein KGI08_07520 [Thaumarchaeota archaeon]|nr:hypothetical protein [Nitrososphaerota archaeon]